MTPRIENNHEMKLVGMKLKMSFAEYRVAELWKSFMPRRKEIKNNVSTDLISLVVYQPNHFAQFNPRNEFERWATVEVSDFDNVPEGMETLLVPAGIYAVFHHKGDALKFQKTWQYILQTWLPASEYSMDDRPHFEVLGEKYKNNDPDSEEEIWIPVKTKQ